MAQKPAYPLRIQRDQRLLRQTHLRWMVKITQIRVSGVQRVAPLVHRQAQTCTQNKMQRTGQPKGIPMPTYRIEMLEGRTVEQKKSWHKKSPALPWRSWATRPTRSTL